MSRESRGGRGQRISQGQGGRANGSKGARLTPRFLHGHAVGRRGVPRQEALAARKLLRDRAQEDRLLARVPRARRRAADPRARRERFVAREHHRLHGDRARAASPPRAPNHTAHEHASAISNAPYATSPATESFCGAFLVFVLLAAGTQS